MQGLVHSEGFEPSTLGAEIRYSIQLNYECNYSLNKFISNPRSRNPIFPAPVRNQVKRTTSVCFLF